MGLATDIVAIGEIQAALIQALDRQDIEAVEAASSQLARATAQLRRHGAVHDTADSLQSINHALRQNDAAKSRLAYLADRNRQKIDALALLRNGDQLHLYKKY